MTEMVVSLMVLLIGLGGIFSTSAQCFTLLRRSKEFVAARENILCRLDTIRTLSFAQTAKSSYLGSTLLVSGTAGDASPFGSTTDGMKNLTETVTVYALGAKLFANATDRAASTPEIAGQYGSQLDTVAPAAPTTYKASSTNTGDWAVQVVGALPSIKVTRTGTGAKAVTTVVTAGDLTSYPQLRVDVSYTWTDSKGAVRTQVASTIVSKSGTLL